MKQQSLDTLRKLASNPHYKFTEAEAAQLQRAQDREYDKAKNEPVKHSTSFQKHDPTLKKEEDDEQDSSQATTNNS
jgi:hypothetical protein